MKKISWLVLALIAVLASSAYAGSGRKSVTTAGTAVALSSTATPFTILDVCADPDNTGRIAVGTTPVASTTVPEGVDLGPGDCYTIENKGYLKLTQIKIDSTVNLESVAYEYWYN